MTLKSLARALMTVGLLAVFPATQAMDPRFTDANGDLVADAPADASQWVNPSTLVFAYTPVEDPAVYAKVWEGFLKHMEAVTGKPVQFFPVQNNAAQVEAMRAGRLHVAGFNTGSTPLAVNCAGYVPFAMMTSLDDRYGYEMEIITHPQSGIDSVEGIRGQKLAFTAETSNSGYKAPSALLEREFNMVAGRDFEPVFSGRHDNSILGVVNRDYPAAAVANSVKNRMIARNAVDVNALRVLYTSATFPTTSYGHVHNLHPELAAKVREAFFTFNWEGSALAAEFNTAEPPQEKFMEITFQEHWKLVRDIDAQMNVSYTCR